MCLFMAPFWAAHSFVLSFAFCPGGPLRAIFPLVFATNFFFLCSCCSSNAGRVRIMARFGALRANFSRSRRDPLFS
uniref:Uncharacterized protein n=1 Tax=Anopheles darlingi TaxID=43151 RepID=A0A2M4DN05_ANODA